MQGFSPAFRWAGITLLALGGSVVPNSAASLFDPLPIDRPRAMAVLDFNADGHDDLVVTHSLSNQVLILLGDGTGNFIQSTGSPIAAPARPVSVAATMLPNAVFDGSAPNLVVVVVGNVGLFGPLGGSIPTVRILPGLVVPGICFGGANDQMSCTRDGDCPGGTCDKFCLGGANDQMSCTETTECPGGACEGLEVNFPEDLKIDIFVGEAPNSIILADFTNDLPEPIADMAFSVAGLNRVTTLRGAADGTFSSGSNPEVGVDCPTPPPTATAGVNPLVAGDWDQDGFLDLAVANSFDSTISLLRGLGDATFTSWGTPAGCLDPCPTCRAPTAISTADIDGDGMSDLAVSNSGGTCGAGDVNEFKPCFIDTDCHATAHCSLTLTTPCTEVGKPGICPLGETCIGEQDGTCNRSDSVGLYFGRQAQCNLTPTAECFVVGVQDVCLAGEICEAAPFGPEQSFPVTPGDSPADLLVTDLDDANGPDLILANFAVDSLEVFLNDGRGGFTGPDSFPLETSPNTIQAPTALAVLDPGTCTGGGISDGSQCLENSQCDAITPGDGNGTCTLGAPRRVVAAHFDTDNYTVLDNLTVAGFPADLPIQRIGSTSGLDAPDGLLQGQFNLNFNEDLLALGPGGGGAQAQIITTANPDLLLRLSVFPLPVTEISEAIVDDFNGDAISDVALAGRGGQLNQGGIQVMLGSLLGGLEAGSCSADSVTPGFPCEPGSAICTDGTCVAIPFLPLPAPGGDVPSALTSGELNPFDNDFDGIPDTIDNCPTVANPTQTDQNGNGVGDECDLGFILDPCGDTPGNDDCDADGITNPNDNCPATANSTQADQNSNGIGDACENAGNADLLAVGADGVVHTFLGRGDGTFAPSPFPSFPGPDPSTTGAVVADFNSLDREMDRFFDLLFDNCPTTANPGQTDSNSDGIGDLCDLGADPNPCGGPPSNNDCDADTFDNPNDNCPAQSNPLQEDKGSCESGNLNSGEVCFVDSDCNATASCDEVPNDPCGNPGDPCGTNGTCVGNGDGICRGNGVGEQCAVLANATFPAIDAILGSAAGLTHYGGDGKAELLHPSADLIRSCASSDLNSGDTCIGDIECDQTAQCASGNCQSGICNLGSCFGGLIPGDACATDTECHDTANCSFTTSTACNIPGVQDTCPLNETCIGNGDGDCQGNDLNAGDTCLLDSQCDLSLVCSPGSDNPGAPCATFLDCPNGFCAGDGMGDCIGGDLNAGASCSTVPACDAADLNPAAACLDDSDCHSTAHCSITTSTECFTVGIQDVCTLGETCLGDGNGFCTGACNATATCHSDDLNAGNSCIADSNCDAVTPGDGNGTCVGNGDGVCQGGDLNSGATCSPDPACDAGDLNPGASCRDDGDCHFTAHCSMTTSMPCLNPGVQDVCPGGETCNGDGNGFCTGVCNANFPGDGNGTCRGNGDGTCDYDPLISPLDPGSTPIAFLKIGSFDLQNPVGLAVVRRGACAAVDLNAGAACLDDAECDQATPGDGLGSCVPPGSVSVLVLERPLGGVFRETASLDTSDPTAVISDLTIGDLNGDSLDDIAWTEENLDRVVVWLGAGDGEFFLAPGSPYPVGDAPSGISLIQANDDNGDGIAGSLDQQDICITQKGSNNVLILRNRLTRRADINGSGRVDGFDLARLGRSFGLSYDLTNPPGGMIPPSDLDLDGDVDGIDLSLFTIRFGDQF